MRLALTLLLLASSLLAQSKPDFSGVFVRTETRFHNKIKPAIPRVLEIRQSAEQIDATATQNLEKATLRYRLIGKKSEKQARLKGKNLLVRTTSVVQLPSFGLFALNRPLTLTVEEKWELSPDGQRLIIHEKGGASGEYAEVYTREPSSEAALAVAAAAASKECLGTSPLFAAKDQTQTSHTYKQGLNLGITSVRRIT